MSWATRTRMAAVASAFALLNGCDAFTDPKSPITIELAESEITAVPGQIGPGPYRDPRVYIRFTVHRNGWDGPIELSFEAPPPLIAPQPASLTDPAPTLEGALGFLVPAGTAAGDYRVTVRATAGSLGSVAASFTLSIQPFSMWLYQPTVKVNRGATNTLTVYTTKDPSVSIQASVSNAPAGVTIVSSVAGATAYLDITAAGDAPLQTQPVTVTLSGSGFSDSREFQVAVQSPPVKREIAFRACRSQFIGFDQVPGTYAYANDGEGWTTVVPDQDDMIRIQAAERVSFANTYWYSSGLYEGGPTTRVLHATAAEFEEMQCASASRGSKGFKIAASNAETYQLTLGAFRALSTSFVSSYGAARSGPHDLVAIGARAVPPGLQHMAILRRGVDLASGSTIALDFGAPEAVVLDSATQTVPELGLQGIVTSRIHTPTTIATIRSLSAQQVGSWYWAIPEPLLLASDVQSLTFTHTDFEAGRSKGAVYYFRSAQPVTATFGPDVAAPTADPETHTIRVASQPDYPDLAGVGYRHAIDYRGTYHQVEVWQTKGFVGATPQTWTFMLPDLGRFVSVPPLSPALGAAAASGRASLFFGGTPAPGTVLRWALSPPGRFAQLLPFPTGR